MSKPQLAAHKVYSLYQYALNAPDVFLRAHARRAYTFQAQCQEHDQKAYENGQCPYCGLSIVREGDED